MVCKASGGKYKKGKGFNLIVEYQILYGSLVDRIAKAWGCPVDKLILKMDSYRDIYGQTISHRIQAKMLSIKGIKDSAANIAWWRTKLGLYGTLKGRPKLIIDIERLRKEVLSNN